MQRKIFMVFLLLSLLILQGCVQEITIRERLLCLQLASHSEQEVPECSSQGECLALVEQNFSFEDGLFSSTVREKLHLYKNHLARSWLFYNRALVNIREIYNICYSADDVLGIGRQINEFNTNLIQAFSELDSAAKISFSVLFLEKADLEAEGAELVKEENIFNDYIAVNSNINELALRGKGNSDTYVSRYFSAAESFNELAESLGFRESLVTEEYRLDLVESMGEDALGKIPKELFLIPVTAEQLTESIRHVAEVLGLGGAVLVLQNSNSFGLFNSYNNFAGTGDSAAKKFAELLGSDHAHRQELAEREEWLLGNIAAELSGIGAKIASLDSTAYSSFDREFLSGLYSLLGQESKIATQSYSIADISKIKSESTAKYLLLLDREQEILDAKLFGNLGLGERVNNLKRLYIDASGLGDEIDFAGGEIVSGLEVLCDSRVSFIENGIKETGLSEVQLSLAGDLKSRLDYRAKNYASLGDVAEKFPLCRLIVSDYLLFKSALRDRNEYESSTGSAIGQCMDYLAAAFSMPGIGLDGYRAVFETLAAMGEPYENPGQVLDSCMHLKGNAESILLQKPGAMEAIGNHSASREVLDSLAVLAGISPNSVPGSVIGALEKKFSSQEKYFPSSKMDALLALPVIDELNASSAALLKEAKAEFMNALAHYLAGNAKLEFFASETPELNKGHGSKIKVTFNNRLFEVNDSLELELPFPFPKAQLAYRSPNVLGFSFEGENLSVKLDSMPLGQTALVFDSNQLLATGTETTKLLLVDSDRAVIEKQLTVHTKGNMARLMVSLNIPDPGKANEGDIFVYSNGKKLDYYFDDAIVFFLENPVDGQQVEAYYSINNPLSHSIELRGQREIDSNTINYEYLVEIRNNLEFSLENTKISIPFAGKKNGVVASEFFNSSGDGLKFDMLPIGKISFTIASLPPNQSWQGVLSITVRDYNAYWNRVLQDAERKLGLLANSPDQGILQEAKKLLGDLDSLKTGGDFSGKGGLNELMDIGNNAELLAGREDKLRQDFARYVLLKEDFVNEVRARERELESLREYSFDAEADSLEGILQGAKGIIDSANGIERAGDLNAAFPLLFAARAKLSEYNPKELGEIILSEKEMQLSAANSIFSLGQKHSLPKNGKLGEILSIGDGISRHVMRNEPALAREKLDSLAAAIRDFNNSMQLSLGTSAARANERIDAYLELSGEIPGLLAELTGILDAPGELDFGAIPYVLPITNSRLGELALQFSRADSVSLREKIALFLRHRDSNDFLAALEIADELGPELEETMLGFGAIHSELLRNLGKVKEDAVTLFNSAVAKFGGSGYNDAARQNIDAAKKEIERGNYLESIALSNSASGLLSLEEFGTGFEVPLAVIPLVAIIGAVLYFRHRKNSAEKIKVRVQKMLRNH